MKMSPRRVVWAPWCTLAATVIVSLTNPPIITHNFLLFVSFLGPPVATKGTPKTTLPRFRDEKEK